jgi:hypothetical protein
MDVPTSPEQDFGLSSIRKKNGRKNSRCTDPF